MAKHLIFLVHGAGTYTKDGKPNTQDEWFTSAKKAIEDAYNSHDFLKPREFSKTFEFKEIVYDHDFHELVTAWAKGAEVYSKALKGNPIAATLFDFFKGAGKTEDNFLWTNAADLILYAAFGSGSDLVRPFVISTARKQFSEALRDAGGKRWSIIAHSLGTAVAHDTLSQMSKSGEFKKFNRPEVVAMIANLSRVLEDETFGGEVYTSPVRPGASTENYISALHRYDPVSFFKQFDPPSSLPGWKHDNNPDRDQFFDKLHGLDHFIFDGAKGELPKLKFSNPITHNFAHYFAHPKVHLTYFARARSDLEITDTQINEAALAFKKKQNEALKDMVQAAFDDVGAGDANADLGSFLDILKVIYKKWG